MRMLSRDTRWSLNLFAKEKTTTYLHLGKGLAAAVVVIVLSFALFFIRALVRIWH